MGAVPLNTLAINLSCVATFANPPIVLEQIQQLGYHGVLGLEYAPSMDEEVPPSRTLACRLKRGFQEDACPLIRLPIDFRSGRGI